MTGSAVDVAIVGGRCAGASLAIHLARQGRRVCLVERATELTPVPSTHFIWPDGVRALHELGVLPALHATAAPPVTGLSGRIEDVDISCRFAPPLIPRGGGAARASGETSVPAPYALCVRRQTLDRVLLDEAHRAGADVRMGTELVKLTWREGRVGGMNVRGPGGVETIAASLVVGADGRRSAVAAAVGAREYGLVPSDHHTLWTYVRPPAGQAAELEPRLVFVHTGEVRHLASPADDGLWLVAVALPQAQLRARRSGDRSGGRSSLADAFWDHARACPELAELLSAAEPADMVHSRAAGRGYSRHAAGPGWVLVGDAGHYKDPCCGRGISDAFRQTATLAACLRDVDLADHRRVDAATRRYWRQRDAAHAPFAAFMASQSDPSYTPLRMALLRVVVGQAGGTERLAGVSSLDTPPSEAVGPRRFLRGLVRCLRDDPRGLRTTVGDVGLMLRREVTFRARHWWEPRAGRARPIRSPTAVAYGR